MSGFVDKTLEVNIHQNVGCKLCDSQGCNGRLRIVLMYSINTYVVLKKRKTEQMQLIPARSGRQLVLH